MVVLKNQFSQSQNFQLKLKLIEMISHIEIQLFRLKISHFRIFQISATNFVSIFDLYISISFT